MNVTKTKPPRSSAEAEEPAGDKAWIPDDDTIIPVRNQPEEKA